MATFELAAGKPSVEVKARLAVAAGDAELQRRARRVVDHQVGPEQRPAAAAAQARGVAVAVAVAGAAEGRAPQRIARLRQRGRHHDRALAAGQIGAEGACDLLTGRLRQQRAAQMAEDGVAHQPALVDHHRDRLGMRLAREQIEAGPRLARRGRDQRVIDRIADAKPLRRDRDEALVAGLRDVIAARAGVAAATRHSCRHCCRARTRCRCGSWSA